MIDYSTPFDGCDFTLLCSRTPFKVPVPIEIILMEKTKGGEWVVGIYYAELTVSGRPQAEFLFSSKDEAAQAFGDHVFMSYFIVHQKIDRAAQFKREAIARARSLS